MNSEPLKRARARLDNLRRRQKTLDLTAALLNSVAIVVPVWLLAMAVESLLRLDITGRSVALTVAVGVTLITAAVAVVTVVRAPHLKTGRTAEEYWALKLGYAAPDLLRDRLLNAIQVARHKPTTRDRFSPDLAAQALYRAVADMDQVTDQSALDLTRRRRAIRRGAAAIVAASVLLLLLPGSIGGAANRLLHPGTDFAVPPPFTLEVHPAGGWAYRGEPVSFLVSAVGIPPHEGYFVHRFAGGKPQETRFSFSGDSGRVAFDGFSEPLRYSIRSGAVTTPEYRLEIITRPRITDLRIRLHPPAYSNLPVVNEPPNVGDLEGLPGSGVELSLETNKPLGAAWVVFVRDDEAHTPLDSIRMTTDDRRAHLHWKLWREARYQVRLRDRDNHPDSDPVTYSIGVIPDQPPAVAIIFPDTDIDLGENMALPLLVESHDDFAVSRMYLIWRRLEDEAGEDSLELQFTPGADIQLQTAWNLSDLDLFPGDVLEYLVAAYDNDAVSGPKRAESERRMVRLPTVEEIIAGVDQAEEEGFQQAEETVKAARELKEEVARIVEDIKRNPEGDWERKRQIESSLEQQAALEQQVQEFSKRLDELVERLEKHDLPAAETLEKYQELQRLLDEVATPELREAMEKLQQAMETQDPDRIREAMEQFDINREQFLQNIERSLNILKQLQLERKLDELVNRARELLHRQEDILDQLQTDTTADLASREGALADLTRKLQEDISAVRNLADSSGEASLATALDSLSAATAALDIPAGMERAAQALEAGNRREAGGQAEKSARQLAELAAGLQSVSTDFKESNKTELAAKLRRLTAELLYLSTWQEQLTAESRELDTSSPRYRALAGFQVDVREALQQVTEKLFILSRETFFITPDLAAALGDADRQLARALEGYSGRNPRSVATPQRRALGDVNNAARKLLDIQGQMAGSQSATGFEEMMQRLGEMASAQQQLNQQSMPMPGSEGQPMLMPGGEQLQRMAAQQRALQEAMQQVAGEGRGMQEILGDLQGIADAMGDVADDLENRSITERTRRLQRRIVSRLLDATRSVQEREYSRRRESRTGITGVRPSPPELKLNADRNKLRQDLLKALQEGYSRDYRQLIRDYFRAMEGSEATPPH